MRPLFLAGLLAGLPALVAAQALLEPPPPPPSAFEREIAAIDTLEPLEARLATLTGADDVSDRIVVLKRLVRLQPQVGRHRLELAAAYAALADRRQAYDLLLRMHGQGYAFDLAADGRFQPVADTRVWNYLVENYEANRQPFGSGRVEFELPAADQLHESLAWDARHARWLFGSMRSGNILARNADGELHTFIEASAENGLWSVFDIKVDPQRGKLWAVSVAMPFFEALRPEQLGLSGLFRFDLESGELERRWLLPPDGNLTALSALALGKRGEAYVADSINRTVYVADEDGMRVFFSSPRLRALRALAVSEDGNLLYVADYDAGVLVIDLARSQAYDLLVPESLTLDGVESLHLWQGHLISVQTGTDPAMRVMRMKLSDNGRQVVRAQPIDANHEALALPVSGTLVENALYFIANSQKRLYGESGRLREGVAPEPLQVFRSDLDSVPERPAREGPDAAAN